MYWSRNPTAIISSIQILPCGCSLFCMVQQANFSMRRREIATAWLENSSGVPFWIGVTAAVDAAIWSTFEPARLRVAPA